MPSGASREKETMSDNAADNGAAAIIFSTIDDVRIKIQVSAAGG
jgi:hypothetical protein